MRNETFIYKQKKSNQQYYTHNSQIKIPKIEIALKDGCERHQNTRIKLVSSKVGDGYVVRMLTDMFQEAGDSN